MRKGYVAKLVMLALSTLVGVSLGEIAVRWIRPQPLSIWSHTRDGIVIHQAGIRGFTSPAGKRIDTNSVGMRDGEHSLEKPAGSFRILLFGDSFMEAMQVNWDDSLAARLGFRLNELTGRDIEIINASVSGWGTDSQLAYYLRYARAFSPDLILLAMTLHNDVSDNLGMQFHSFENGELVERPREYASSYTLAWQRVQEWLASNSHLYWLVRGRIRAKAVRDGGVQLERHVSELVRRSPSLRVRTGWAMTLQLLDEMHAKGAEAGAEMAVFMIPLALQVTDARLERFLDAAALDASQLALERPQEIMLSWGAARDVKVMDLLPGFRAWAAVNRADPYLVKDGHWNEEGHALAAEIVADELVASGLIPSLHSSAKDSSR